MSKEIHKKIKDFLEYLEIDRGLAKKTIENYNFYLTRFADFAAKKNITTPGGINKTISHEYRLHLNRLGEKDKRIDNNNNLKKNTQNYHLIALRGFLKYLIKNDIKTLEPDKIELAKQEQRQVDFLEGNDLTRLLGTPLTTNADEIVQCRDKALLETLFSTGLRVSEIANLKIENINLDKSEFTVRGKGSKVRVVFIADEARHWLKKYKAKRQDMNPHLFIGHDKANKDSEKGITPRSIERIVQKYAKLAGIMKKVTPHTLRHSYATDLLMNGADIRSVQAMLGHSSITTTQVYTHITDQQLRDVHKAFHGKTRK